MKNFAKLLIPLFLLTLFAQTTLAAFSDVDPAHENYHAINYLERTGIIEGYSDGTFRPEQNVVRAEAVKIIMAPLYESFDTVSENPFPDVTPEQWFAAFVKKAKDENVISGDGETGNFEGARNVNLAEFLKILTLAYKVDLNGYQNPSEILFDDVQDLNQWFVPYLYYAASTNLVHAEDDNNIYPGKDLTRADVAEITFRLIINVQGGDVQLYLSMSEAEMIKVLQYLDNNDIDNAEVAVAKAVQYSSNAVSLSPDVVIVLAADKIAQSFNELVKAYRAGLNLDFVAVEANAGLAWNLAAEAVNLDESVRTLAETIQNIAHDMAEDARLHQ
ncbi:S-layer homology domain-containing protein [Patescibacteria group bacterium]